MRVLKTWDYLIIRKEMLFIMKRILEANHMTASPPSPCLIPLISYH